MVCYIEATFIDSDLYIEVPFIDNYLLYIEVPFTHSDLLCRGALYRQLFVI